MMKVVVLVLLVGLAAALTKKAAKGKFTRRAAEQCAEDEYQCKNGECIQEEWTCDTENDCWDNSDETLPDCPPRGQCTGPHEFKCTTYNKCIPIEYRCDGDNDCYDRTDETGCSMFECTGGELHCDNGICIEEAALCDGRNDCLDRWDENPANCPSAKPTTA